MTFISKPLPTDRQILINDELKVVRICPTCNASFVLTRIDRETCSRKCKKRRNRQEKRLKECNEWKRVEGELVTERICKGCGFPFISKRLEALTCSARCRKRRERAEAAAAEASAIAIAAPPATEALEPIDPIRAGRLARLAAAAEIGAAEVRRRSEEKAAELRAWAAEAAAACDEHLRQLEAEQWHN